MLNSIMSGALQAPPPAIAAPVAPTIQVVPIAAPAAAPPSQEPVVVYQAQPPGGTSKGKTAIYVVICIVCLLVIVGIIVAIVILVRRRISDSQKQVFFVDASNFGAMPISMATVNKFMKDRGWTISTQDQFNAAKTAGAQWCELAYFNPDANGNITLYGSPQQLVTPKCLDGTPKAAAPDANGNLVFNSPSPPTILGVLAFGVKPKTPHDALESKLNLEFFTVGPVTAGGLDKRIWSQFDAK